MPDKHLQQRGSSTKSGQLSGRVPGYTSDDLWGCHWLDPLSTCLLRLRSALSPLIDDMLLLLKAIVSPSSFFPSVLFLYTLYVIYSALLRLALVNCPHRILHRATWPALCNRSGLLPPSPRHLVVSSSGWITLSRTRPLATF